MESCCLFLEEDQVEPSGKEQIAITKSIALPCIFSLLIEDASAESVAVDAQAVCCSVEGGFA